MGSFLKIGQGAYELCLFKYGDFYLNVRHNYRSIWAKISESGGNSKSRFVKVPTSGCTELQNDCTMSYS